LWLVGVVAVELKMLMAEEAEEEQEVCLLQQDMQLLLVHPLQ
jgi:hypothetical protein